MGKLKENPEAGNNLLEKQGVLSQKGLEDELQRKNRYLSNLIEIGQKFSESLDLDVILQTIVEKGTFMTGLDTGAIYLLKSDLLYLGATIPVLPPDFPDAFRVASLKDQHLIMNALKTGLPVAVADTETAVMTPSERAIAEARNVRSMIFVPMKLGDQGVGILIMGTIDRVREFLPIEVEMYKTLANQASLSVINANLYRDTLNYVSELENQIKARKEAEISLRESEERFRAYINQAADALFVHDFTGRFVDVNPKACATLGYTREEFLQMNVTDVETDFNLDDSRETWSRIKTNQQLVLYGHHRRKDGSTFPVEVHFGSFELKGERYIMGLVRDITERIADETLLRNTMNRLIITEELLRKEAASQLHDHVGQNLTALNLNITYIDQVVKELNNQQLDKRLADSARIIEDTVERIRNIMADLRPSVLDEFGLHAALKWSLNTFEQRTSVRVKYAGREIMPRLPVNAEYALFRMVQEALHNVIKHSGATEVDVNLTSNPSEIILSVKDNGKGFDLSVMALRTPERGLGLLGITERMKALGGTFQIESAPGRGSLLIFVYKIIKDDPGTDR